MTDFDLFDVFCYCAGCIMAFWMGFCSRKDVKKFEKKLAKIEKELDNINKKNKKRRIK